MSAQPPGGDQPPVGPVPSDPPAGPSATPARHLARGEHAPGTGGEPGAAVQAVSRLSDTTLRSLRILLGRARARQGWARVRAAFWPVLVGAAGAGVAYAFSHYGLGHPFPFFAATSAWICLGFAPDRQPRRVLELALGVTLGIAIGDGIVHVIGSGAWQVSFVLAFAALVGRFIDKGQLLTNQAGVQAVVIVLLPASTTGGPLSRLTDGLVGGGVALGIAVLSPRDPRRRLARLGQEVFDELADTLELLARGLGRHDTDRIDAALLRGRASEPALADWRDSARTAQDLTRVNPRAWRHSEVIDRTVQQAVLADRVMRTVRVLARRARALTPGEHETRAFARVLAQYAVAARDLSTAVGEGRDPVRARSGLVAVAASLDPHRLAPDDWEVQSLVLVVRSAVVDLLEAAGEDPAEARSALPAL